MCEADGNLGLYQSLGVCSCSTRNDGFKAVTDACGVSKEAEAPRAFVVSYRFGRRSCDMVTKHIQNSLKLYWCGFQRRRREAVERVKRIELSYAAWEAAVLPLNYTRDRFAVAPSISGMVACLFERCDFQVDPVIGPGPAPDRIGCG